MLFQRSGLIGFVFGFLILGLSTASFAANAKSLPLHYRQWLNQDVVYIISTDERNAFLALSSDEARDRFIDHFWEIRNPTPNSPDNSYKAETYRRFAFANERYGWRSDRGRVYIQLGEPQQRGLFYGASQTKPFEIWFYQNANPALPPYFNILFYQKEIGDDFRIYSPKFDGPDKLVTNSKAINDPKAAFKLIDGELGREVSRTTLSLLPNAQVDTQNVSADLDSDLMLATLRNLPNNPLTKEMISRNQDRLSSVTHRMILEGDYLGVLTDTLRDEGGEPFVHYLLRVKTPEDFTVGKDGDRYYYNVQVTIVVRDDKNTIVLTEDYPIGNKLTQQEFAEIKQRNFGVQGVLPLPPGKYKVEFTLTDKLSTTAWRQSREIVIEAAPVDGIGISPIIVFNSITQLESGVFAPFGAGKLKFNPDMSDQVTTTLRDPLRIMYQLWVAPGNRQRSDKKLHVDYVFGRLGGSAAEATHVQEDVAMEQFNESGVLVTGKKLQTDPLPAGNYRLVVTATDPDTSRKTYSSLNFTISALPKQGSWYVSQPSLQLRYSGGDFDVLRGTVLDNEKKHSEALQLYRKALQRNPENEGAREQLVQESYKNLDFKAVAGLYSNKSITEKTPERTVFYYAESFEKVGQLRSAIEVLENSLSVKGPSEPVLTALVRFYEEAGEPRKVAEIKRKIVAISK